MGGPNHDSGQRFGGAVRTQLVDILPPSLRHLVILCQRMLAYRNNGVEPAEEMDREVDERQVANLAYNRRFTALREIHVDTMTTFSIPLDG